MSSIREKINIIIWEEFQLVVYDDQIDLMSEGYIDSIGVLTLFVELEDKFGIEITFEDLYSPNIRSLAGLEIFVQQKTEKL